MSCLTAYFCAYCSYFLPCLSVTRPISQASRLLSIELVPEYLASLCSPTSLLTIFMLIFPSLAYLVTLFSTTLFVTHHSLHWSKQCDELIFTKLSQAPFWAWACDSWPYVGPSYPTQSLSTSWACWGLFNRWSMSLCLPIHNNPLNHSVSLHHFHKLL